KVAPLDILKRLCDAMQHLVLRRVSPDRGRGVPAVGVEPLPARAVTLRPKAPEPDAGFLPRSAAPQAGGSGLEADAEDLGDALEILINGVVPIVVEAAIAIPRAGLVLRRVGKLVEAIDHGFDNLRHGD